MKKICITLMSMLLMQNLIASKRFIQGIGVNKYCVIDNKTNLMWSKSPLPGKYTWDGAVKTIKQSRLCSYSDWRLPTKEEIYNLQKNSGYYAPFAWLNTNGFDNVQTEFYWSNEEYVADQDSAWGFYMYSGRVYYEPKTNKNYAWQVRNIK